MLNVVSGDMFSRNYQCITCPVNTVGTMGNGLALYFAKRYPEIVPMYLELLSRGELDVGRPALVQSKYGQEIMLFVTKRDWRNSSDIDYIDKGLRFFVEESSFGVFHHINEIAMPALGCGKGQLEFEQQVRPVFEQYLEPWFGEATVFDH